MCRCALLGQYVFKHLRSVRTCTPLISVASSFASSSYAHQMSISNQPVAQNLAADLQLFLYAGAVQVAVCVIAAATHLLQARLTG